MRVPMIAGNWKMNTNHQEAVKLVKDLDAGLNERIPVDVVACPPFISLASVSEALTGSQIRVGAQNMYFEEKGAYTGEVSALMLKGLCQYVILGHSERRQYFLETDEIVSRKIKMALKYQLKPILCVGENLEQNEAGKTEEVVTRQIRRSLDGIETIETLIVAYEPIWAIGTGKAATGDLANRTISLIRSLLQQKYSAQAANAIRILYGGSVTAGNIGEFVSQSDIDGGLVGGASLKVSEFLSIIRTTAQLRGGV
ncbi:MAG TPA: triose-phosphate isomerase [Dehalococcoidales bacterium]|nr:triose-phosphate isomerase [Dehalococcoidales bacterium]